MTEIIGASFEVWLKVPQFLSTFSTFHYLQLFCISTFLYIFIVIYILLVLYVAQLHSAFNLFIDSGRAVFMYIISVHIVQKCRRAYSEKFLAPILQKQPLFLPSCVSFRHICINEYYV